MDATTTAIEIRGAGSGPLDEPLLLRARGAGDAGGLLWRARLHDDDGRVWHARAASPELLAGTWRAAKATTGPFAALQSLRPLRIDVQVEAPDGRGATRTFTRLLVGEGVRIRRWRDEALAAVLALPAAAHARTSVVIDATASPQAAAVAALAAPLLASRGVLTLVVPPARGAASADALLDLAAERLAAVPGAAAEIARLSALAPREAPPAGAREGIVELPPGVAARDGDAAAVAARAAAWDALLARLGALPRALGERDVSR